MEACEQAVEGAEGGVGRGGDVRAVRVPPVGAMQCVVRVGCETALLLSRTPQQFLDSKFLAGCTNSNIMSDTTVDDINGDASRRSEGQGLDGGILPNSEEQYEKDDLYYLESVVFKVTYIYR